MKKLFTVVAATMLYMVSFGQEFMGVKVDGSKASIIAKFKQKGFVIDAQQKTLVSFKGRLNGRVIELYTYYTPKTQKCWKFKVYLPEQSTWSDLKSDYKKYVDLFTEKFGTPEEEYSLFTKPYYEGDGYEISAVKAEKCLYASFWKGMYAIQISKFCQIEIHYDNQINSEINTEETKSIDVENF